MAKVVEADPMVPRLAGDLEEDMGIGGDHSTRSVEPQPLPRGSQPIGFRAQFMPYKAFGLSEISLRKASFEILSPNALSSSMISGPWSSWG